MAVALATAAPEEARAQLLRPRLEISPYAGGLFTGDVGVQELEDSPVLGVRAGVRLPLGLAVEGQLGYAALESQSVGLDEAPVAFDVGLLLYEAGVVYAFPLPGPLDPFVGVAAGGVRFDPDLEVEGEELQDETSLAASVGAGVRLDLAGLHLRADLREHLVLDALEETSAELSADGAGETLSALEASLGISLLF
ncbi:MAG: outer membrane beta-barrel protein [Gemmatimonadota bacterium]